MGVGACTGDWSYFLVDAQDQLKVSLSVGVRRYLEKDSGLRSTAQPYEIYSFSDIAAAVPEALASQSHLMRSGKLKSRKGIDVLILRFLGSESPDGPRMTTLFAFTEIEGKQSALEISCRFGKGHEMVGEQAFKAALESVTEPELAVNGKR